MAVEWPDFSQATITDATTFDALKRAYAERCAAASAGVGYAVAHDAEFWGADVTPDLDRLTQFRRALQALAPKFVRLEDERYQWQAWSRFPIAYAGTDLMKGEHSLAILPAPGTPEGDSARLEEYRRFLANCAWWLKRFRYVYVGDQSFYTRQAEARGNKYIQDYPWWDEYRHEESGEEPETYMASPEISATGTRYPPKASGYMIRCYHWDSETWDDSFEGKKTGWKYDTYHYQWREVNATAYSGLVVRNFSGLPGALILVPCYERSTRGEHPSRSVETDFIDTVMPTSFFSDDGDRMAETVVDTDTREEKHGDAWLETYRSVFRGRQWYEQLSESSAAIRHEGAQDWTKTVWSLDGSRHLDETGADTSTNWYNYTLWERSETYVNDFDGFGEWELGQPVEGGIVPAHGLMVAIPEREDIPLPDVWDLTCFRKWRRELHPRDHDDDVHYTAYLRIAPILDFNSSYLYQDT